MPNLTQSRIRQEVEFIERFSQTYGTKFGALIERLNASPAESVEGQCLRLCVEAMNMVVSVQAHLARALADLSQA